MVIHELDCHGKDYSKKLYWNLDVRKFRIGNVCSFIEHKFYFSVRNVEAIHMTERSRMTHMSKKMMKNVGIDEPTSFLDHVYLECIQCE